MTEKKGGVYNTSERLGGGGERGGYIIHQKDWLGEGKEGWGGGEQGRRASKY